MGAYYAVKKLASGGAVIESNNVVAKEGLWGWGSDQNAVDGSFYGRQLGDFRGDNTRYRWTLSAAGVREITRLIRAHVDDRSYYETEADRKAARELLQKLTKPTPRKKPKKPRQRKQ